MAITSFVGCTEYMGPPASPEYWRPKPPDPNPPQALIQSEPEPEAEDEPTQTPRELMAAAPVDPAPKARPRSINLGYTGDGVLAGGITRDTEITPRQAPSPYAYQSWQDYVNAPRWRAAGPQWRGRVGPLPGYGYGAPYGVAPPGMGPVPPCAYSPNGVGPAW
ncbi:MAG: hypothetical protein HY898_15145 [Deltaproteobacteria bacterium]|nr:hypothetical protein [Deltaproteobacteria bacterium]